MTLTMKDRIMKAMYEAQGQPVSGQQLADLLGVSRTAIWKHMQALQQEGYVFDTVKKKGYVLKATPNGLHANDIYFYLATAQFGRTLHILDVVDSTQTIAKELARQQAPNGTVVIAEHQTAGKGRMARPWESLKGKGIWMTVIVRPDIPPQMAPQFTLITAVAVAHAMQATEGVCTKCQPKIKWPNDILMNGKKCTGILTEMQAEADQVNALMIGIGINANHERTDFSDELQHIATSLAIEEGIPINRSALIAQILYYLERYTDLYVKKGFKPIRKMWEELSCTIGQTVEVTTLREVFVGVASGITDDGVLQVTLPTGEVRPIYAGDVKILN